MIKLPKFLGMLLIMLITSPMYAQPLEDFSKIDAFARQTPAAEAISVEQLAGYLTQEAQTDLEKVRAFFVWISENVRYDVPLYFDKTATNQEKLKKQQPKHILKYQKAVCEGYTNLFDDLCKVADITSEKVAGFTRFPDGEINRNGHTWNAVRIEGEWFLVDNTWGAGYVDPEKRRFYKEFQESYFLVKPETFISDHFPNDPLFQMLPNPVSWEQFEMGKGAEKSNLTENSTSAFPNIRDSLNDFHSLDNEKKVLRSCGRILEYDPKNGYANYTLANYYFTLARHSNLSFQEEFNKLAAHPRNVEDKHLKKWKALLAKSKSNCRLSIHYLENIPSANKYSSISKSAKKNVERALRNIREAEKQLVELKAFLKKIK